MNRPTTRQPMTSDLATAVMAQVDLVPKKRASRWTWHSLEVVDSERARVLVQTMTDPRRVAEWFAATGIGCVVDIQWRRGDWFAVTFVCEAAG